jgi:hypothetical protein
VTRGDLPPGDQAVQAAHAALEFAARYPELRPWSGALVLLAAKDELELTWLCAEAYRSGCPLAAFHEPDLGYALTAVALGSSAGALVRRYPLAFSSQRGGEEDE